MNSLSRSDKNVDKGEPISQGSPTMGNCFRSRRRLFDEPASIAAGCLAAPGAQAEVAGSDILKELSKGGEPDLEAPGIRWRLFPPLSGTSKSPPVLTERAFLD